MITATITKATGPDLGDARLVANVAVRQFSDVQELISAPISKLLLNDQYALGYAFGFAEQASRHANADMLDEVGQDYIRDVFGGMLGSPSNADSFVLFAESQRNERLFAHGSQAGVMDLNDWVLSRGQVLPGGLAEHISMHYKKRSYM